MKESVQWQPTTLMTEAVQLVPLKKSDFDDLYAVASDPLVWEQHPMSDRYKKEVFQPYFDSGVASGTAFIIRDKATGEVMGTTRYYQFNPDDRSIAIGYTFLARKYWGGHYNRIIKRLMLDYAFQYVDKVLLHIGPNNLRSQNATKKLGAVKTNEIYMELQNGRSLNYEYTITKEDWIKLRSTF